MSHVETLLNDKFPLSLYQKMLIIAELSMISETIFTILPQSSYPSKTLNCLTNG